MALNLPLSPHLSARFGADATGELTIDGAPERFAEESTQRLREVVLPPTTMPWGNRSTLFRDPDGNLVNLFSRPAQ